MLLVAPHKKYSRYYSEQDKECVEGVLFITTNGTNRQLPEAAFRKYDPEASGDERMAQADGADLQEHAQSAHSGREDKERRRAVLFHRGMLYNVPVSEFGVSYANTVDKCWGWLNSPPDAGALMCANGIHPLIRDNSHTSCPSRAIWTSWRKLKKLWFQWK